jgi:hypothetical protein
MQKHPQRTGVGQVTKGSANASGTRNKGREWRWGYKPSQLPKVEVWWIAKLVLWDRGQYSKLNCPTLLGEELNR